MKMRKKTRLTFRIDTDENGEEVLSEVDDDEEFEIVKDAWKPFVRMNLNLTTKMILMKMMNKSLTEQ